MEFFEVISSRCSTRAYKPEQIKPEELEKILQAAQCAPVGGARYENLRITVIQDAAFLQELVAASGQLTNSPDANPFYGAPTLIVVSAKSASSPNVEYANGACLIENMHLAATAIGLGSVYIWGILSALNTRADLVSKLQIPEGFKPVSALAVGYAAEPLSGARPCPSRYNVRYI